MTTYIRYPIETNPNTLALDVYNYIQSRAPLWTPNDGNLDTWIIQAISTLAAELRDIASDVPAAIFRYFGATMIAYPPQDSTHSTVVSAWTMVDNAGYTIPDGTQLAIRDSAGNLVPFTTTGDVVIPAGSTTANITLRSIDPGADTAGIGGAAVAAQLLDTLAFVSTVILASVTSGGLDAEDDDAYLNRLATHLRLLSTRPILPEDFAILVRDVTGVYRAVAVDGYNPVGPSSNNPRMVYIAAIDINGADVSGPIQAAAAALLQANREVNFVVNVGGATRNQIDVTYDATTKSGYDATSVHADADAALSAFLSSATWGAGDDPRTWLDTPVLRFSEVAQVLSNVEGVAFWATLTIGIHGGGLAAADVNLTGPAALAVAHTLTGTVHQG